MTRQGGGWMRQDTTRVTRHWLALEVGVTSVWDFQIHKRTIFRAISLLGTRARLLISPKHTMKLAPSLHTCCFVAQSGGIIVPLPASYLARKSSNLSANQTVSQIESHLYNQSAKHTSVQPTSNQDNSCRLVCNRVQTTGGHRNSYNRLEWFGVGCGGRVKGYGIHNSIFPDTSRKLRRTWWSQFLPSTLAIFFFNMAVARAFP